MKKAVTIFLMAVLLPALLLGYLSFQSARQQGVLVEDQEARLRQQQVDALATQVALAVRVEHDNFIRAVEGLLKQYSLEVLQVQFNALLEEGWDRESVGFAVGSDGGFLSPAPRQLRQDLLITKREEQFIDANAAFLQNISPAEVYNTTSNGLQVLQEELQLKQQASVPTFKKGIKESREKLGQARTRPQVDSYQGFQDLDQSEQGYSNVKRSVTPQRYALEDNRQQVQPESRLNVELSTFRDLVAGQENGIITRFVNDRLEMLFWMKPDPGQNTVFGAQVLPEHLGDVIDGAIQAGGLNAEEIIGAVLDDRARAFATFPADQKQSVRAWDQPFVASEVGEMLPHWEVALYLKNPGRLTRAAQVSSWTIAGLILISLLAILAGGMLLMLDTRRQLELVQKKTDFVSNVSHELKTPLTSIRMFAELLREKRVEDEARVDRYLNIITVEAERLTRLINNVLDFSRMDRDQKTYHKELLDLHPLIETVWSGQELHLQQEGFSTQWHAEAGSYPIFGDADAIAQILVNLISNAEKYSGAEEEGVREIELHSYQVDEEIRIAVMDRGIGVPAGDEEKIFEHFYRAHDSLATGIQGSGLGLTLASRIARDHGGRITFERRDGGGSRFTLHLPRKESV